MVGRSPPALALSSLGGVTPCSLSWPVSPPSPPQVTFTDISLTVRDQEGATALHFAARGGHMPILERLLLLGAPIVRDSRGGSPLHDAAESGWMEVRRHGGRRRGGLRASKGQQSHARGVMSAPLLLSR